MTEVPDHLLQRSRERRAALGLGGGDGGGEAAAEAAPAAAPEPAAAAPAPAAGGTPTPPAVPAEVAPAEPEPVPPYVEAAERRHKIPLWALPVVAFLPLWGFLYAESLSPPATTEPTPLELGAEIYSANGCAGCHGAGGGGGTGRPLSGGEVLATFPTIEGMLEFVALGSEGVGLGEVYGDPDREGGAHVSGDYEGGALMPAFAETLTPEELLAVVRHERETLSGEELDPARIGPDGELLHEDGSTPYLNDAGELQDAEGEPLFDDEGALLSPPDGGEVAAGDGS